MTALLAMLSLKAWVLRAIFGGWERSHRVQSTIRGLDPAMKINSASARPRTGASMEEEVRVLIRTASDASGGRKRRLGDRIRRRFAGLGDFDLEPLPHQRCVSRSDFSGRTRSEMIILDTNVVSELMKP